MLKKTFISSFVALAVGLSSYAVACTRAVYLGNNQHVITARSMDWKVDTGTNLWILPSGVARDGSAGSKSIKWTSKYGSVIATGYEVSD